MNALAYCLPAHTVLFRVRNPHGSFLFFRSDTDATRYALARDQFLRRPQCISFTFESNG